jgi:outer membrane lipoprotein SlyB
MMKKLLTTLLAFSIAAPAALSSRGGDSAIGGFAGGMFGGLVGGAIARGSSRPSHKEVEHAIQQEKVSQLQREMDKKELETRLEQQRLLTMQQERERSNTLMYVLFGIIFVMFLVVIGLGVLLINMRKKN